MARDIQVSIHGRRIGIDAENNLVVDKLDGKQAIVSPEVAVATTTANLKPYGAHTLSTALVTYVLDDPIPGTEVTITALAAATAATRIVKTSTANSVTFNGTHNQWTSTGVHTLKLLGVSTTRYAVVSNAVGSTLTTSVGAMSTI